MAEENKDDFVKVPSKFLKEMQEQMAENDRKVADMEAKTAGMQELLSKADPEADSKKLRKGKNFEPIPFQNISKQTPTSLLWNTLGRNVRGQRRLSPQEERDMQKERRQQMLKDREKMFNRNRKRGE